MDDGHTAPWIAWLPGVTVQTNFTVIPTILAGEDAHQGGLASTIRACDAKDLAPADRDA